MPSRLASDNADGYGDDCRLGRTADYCAYLHRNISQEDCAACWIAWRADPDYRLAARDNVTAARGGLWDECRGKHMRSEADEGRA